MLSAQWLTKYVAVRIARASEAERDRMAAEIELRAAIFRRAFDEVHMSEGTKDDCSRTASKQRVSRRAV